MRRQTSYVYCGRCHLRLPPVQKQWGGGTCQCALSARPLVRDSLVMDIDRAVRSIPMDRHPLWQRVLEIRSLVMGTVLALLSCHPSSAVWQSTDTTSATHAVQLSQRCGALCLSDAGCPPDVAAGCFESIDCNLGSMLHRHGAPDLDAGLECQP